MEVTLKDRFGAPVATALTDGNGRYLFPGVLPGTGYYVEVTDRLPGGLAQTFPSGRTDNRTGSFSLVAGQSYAQADLGYRSAPTAVVIGDLVWVDADADGAQDVGEPGFANVEVKLKDRFGTPVATALTDGNGRYLFPGVLPGTGYYCCRMPNP